MEERVSNFKFVSECLGEGQVLEYFPTPESGSSVIVSPGVERYLTGSTAPVLILSRR